MQRHDSYLWSVLSPQIEIEDLLPPKTRVISESSWNPLTHSPPNNNSATSKQQQLENVLQPASRQNVWITRFCPWRSIRQARYLVLLFFSVDNQCMHCDSKNRLPATEFPVEILYYFIISSFLSCRLKCSV